MAHPKQSDPRIRYALYGVIILILLFGAYLRLYRISEYLTFLGDEGRDVLIVKRMIVDHNFVLLGPTASVGGFFLGPMYYYFMAPFLWLFYLEPVGPAVMVALFGIITIFLVYYVGKQLFSPQVGIIASSLYALSPLVIAYSRSSWNPNLVPFCSILLIYFLWRYAVYREQKDLFILGLIWGLGIQFHYLFSFLIVFSLLWIAAVDRTWKLVRRYLFVFGGFIITFAPFILFELRHGFPNIRSLVSFFLTGNETGFRANSFLETISDITFRSFGRLLFRMPNYDRWNSFPQEHIILWNIVIRTALYMSLGLLLVFILTRLKRLKNLSQTLSSHFLLSHEQWVGAVLLFCWFTFSIFLFGFYRRGIYDYYFGIFYAFPFLAFALILWQFMRSKIGIVSSFVLWGGLLFFNWEGRPFMYPPNNQVQQTKTIAKAALAMTQGKPFNFALLTSTNSDHAYRYFFEIWGQKPMPIEQPAVDPDRKSVTDQLIIICENPSCHPLGDSLWEIAGFGRAQINKEEYVFPVRIFRLIHYTGRDHD